MTDKIVTWILSVTCTLLAVILLWPYQDGPQSELVQDKKPLNVTSDLLVSNEQAVSADITQYSAIVEQPLFNSNRTPYSEKKVVSISKTVPVVAARSAAKADLPKLIGVMTVSNVEMAFVLGRDDADPVGLKIGDKYLNWTLKVIEATQIIMAYNESEEVIDIDWTLKDMLHNVTDDEQRQITPPTTILPRQSIPSNLKDRLARKLQVSR